MLYYFASLDSENFVNAVHIIDEQNCLDENGQFNENIAINYLNNFHGESRWIRTEQDSNFRYHYAGIGYYYYEEYDAFVPPRPGDDYILSEEFTWTAIDVRQFLDSIEI
jgi:hypothetical protein